MQDILARFSRARVRTAIVVAMALLALVSSLIGSGRAGAVVYTSGNSGCTGAEDPANLYWGSAQIKRFGEILQGQRAAWWISQEHWVAPYSVQSPSWFKFTTPSYPCQSATYWTEDHNVGFSGHHVRFWQPGASWQYVRSNTHTDVPCGLDDSVSDYLGAVGNLVGWFETYKDLDTGRIGWYDVYTTPNPPKLWSKGCGYTPYDDGYVHNLYQYVTVVHSPYAP